MAGSRNVRVSFFEVGRNEPCPCGSDRKYKRCCRIRVDEARRGLRSCLDFPFLDSPAGLALLDGLALACALPADPVLGEEPPARETVAAATHDVLAALEKDGREQEGEQEEEEEEDAVFAPLPATLERLFTEERELRAVRFWPPDMSLALEAAEADLPDGLDEDAAFRRTKDGALRSLVDADLADEVAWQLVDALRRPGKDQEETRALVWGLLLAVLTPHIPLGTNLLWNTVLFLTMDDMEAFQAIVQPIAAADDDPEGAVIHVNLSAFSDSLIPGLDDEQLVRFLEEHPIIDRMISGRILADVTPALDALWSRRIKLVLPPFALAFTMRRFWQIIVEKWKPVPMGATLTDRDLDARLEALKFSPEDWRAISHTAWDHDYPFLVPAVEAALDGWLEENGAADHPELAEAVRRLSELFGSNLFQAQWHIFETVTRIALKETNIGDPAHTGPEPDEEYVAGLEAEGLAAAAAHVRAAARWDGTPPGTWPGPAT